jgi:hypothetical protein
MIKSKSTIEFNKPIDESKELKIDGKVDREPLDMKINKKLTREDKNIIIERLREEIQIEDERQKKEKESKTIKKSSSKWSFCIFCHSETEDTIDISDKPDFSKGKK